MKIYGKNSIIERLKVNPSSIKNIFIEEGERLPEIEGICRSRGIAVNYQSKNKFSKDSAGMRTQGVMAEIGKFVYAGFEDILNKNRDKSLTFLFLDNLNDPQNLGAILRTAACLGGFAVVLPRYDSVEVTEATLRVASGGENYVAVSKVGNLSLSIDRAKACGWWIGGAVVEGGEDLRRHKLNFPLGLVIGSEGKGIRKGLIRHLDFTLTIPMFTPGLSFNVATATALFCYEVSRQRKGCSQDSRLL